MPARSGRGKRGAASTPTAAAAASANSAAGTRTRQTRNTSIAAGTPTAAAAQEAASTRASSSLSSAKSPVGSGTGSVDQIGNEAIDEQGRQEDEDEDEEDGEEDDEEDEEDGDETMEEAAEPMTMNPAALLGQPAGGTRKQTVQAVADDEEGDEDEEEGEGDEVEGDENEDEEEGDEDEEDEEGGDDEDEDEDEDEEGDEDEDEDEEEGDEEEDEDEDEDEDEAGEDEDVVTFKYPAAVPDFQALPDREKRFKVARYFACTVPGCKCPGLQPPEGSNIELLSREEVDAAEANEDVVMDGDEDERTTEGWWKVCGECGHGWDGGGHVLPHGLDENEKKRRGKVVGRIEELLQDADLLTTFPTPTPPDLSALFKQLQQFQRSTGGKKPAAPLPAAFDMTEAGTPLTPADGATPAPGDSDDERPRKRARGSADEAEGDGEEEMATSPRTGRKKSGKTTAGKGTKPRGVVRGSRGLMPTETDAEGNVHVGGRLPDSAVGEGELEGDTQEDDAEVPLAKRPELDEGERRRREMIKEKAKERENKVMRRLNKEVDGGDEEAEEAGRRSGVDVEVWEGVELTKLPLRDAAIEEAKHEIILTVVSSRNPTPIASILLIGLKNLFQRQLPKMPREYITRLVLDKNHISMAIVKRGWKVVGGVCYRPFESRGFAEIVFFAVDSSEQIKGYGSHLMNSLKDHVRKAHPTIENFLTYADNYAVGYFKKQGFSKEINYDRERWVGYIKDYEGGTIMHCHMLPKVEYLNVHQMLADQKAAVLAKIRTISKSHVIHPGIKKFKDRKSGQELKLKKEDIPGLAESGWDPDLDAIIRQPKRNPNHVYLQLVLDDMQNEASAWPFIKPVDGNVVADYYDVIKEPMDLSTMEYKLENNHYVGIDDFISDAHLIFTNCRQYNGETSIYTVQANKLEKAMDRIMKARKGSAKA